MFGYALGLLSFVALSDARGASINYNNGDAELRITEECKSVINAKPVYLDMCQRLCGIVVTHNQCNGMATGQKLAECVAENYPYCYASKTDPDVIEECKNLISSIPSFDDMCKRSCGQSITEGKCLGMKTGAELAECVHQNYRYCTTTPAQPDVLQVCRDNITSEPAFLDMCQRGCAIVVAEKNCNSMNDGKGLANCVSQRFPYCHVKA